MNTVPNVKNKHVHISESMTEDEQKCYTFLEKYYPAYASSYITHLPRGRAGILRRFVSGMLREDVLEIYTNSYDMRKIGSVIAITIPSIDTCWETVIRKLQDSHLEEDKLYKVYFLSEEECLVFPISRTYAFQRVEIAGEILYIDKTGVNYIQSATQFLNILRTHNTDQLSWSGIETELDNGSANLTLAYTFFERDKELLKQKAQQAASMSTIDYVLSEKQQHPSFSSSLFFEQLCVEGHNLHPGAKTKLNMEPEDVVRYAPEFRGEVEMRIVGIRRDYAEWNEIEDAEPNELLYRSYPELQRAAVQEFSNRGLDMADYIIVPTHPWQFQKVIPHIYSEELLHRIVVPIEGISLPLYATSSFRTLVGQQGNLALKVAVNSQMTSTVRSISPHTTNNAVEFTKLIREVMKREAHLADTFIPVCEVGGYNFKAAAHSNTLKSRNLSAVIREDVEAFVHPGEVAIVGSALYAISPITEKPIVIELIELYAQEIGEASLYKAAMKFLAEYGKITLPGFLTLMVKYGIGLEGHLQNSIPVFKNGKPIRMLFRDWGGARIYKHRLQEQGLTVDFYPGSVTLTDSLKEMQNKLFYTVFQNHLGELILQISKYFHLHERVCWDEVRAACDGIFSDLESNQQWQGNVTVDRQCLYEATIQHKALTKMRLLPEGKDSYVTVSNPLYV